MQLICISVSHHNAPVELRECISLSSSTIAAAASQAPIRVGRYAPVTEMAILSTCNRLEIYALVSFPAEDELLSAVLFQPLTDYLEELSGVPLQRIEPHLLRFSGVRVVEHLYRVAAGLDSIAIGETQILGQVARTLDSGLQNGTIRHVLSSLFRSAIQVGKRVRTETVFGRHSTNVSTIAVQLAEKRLGNLGERKILVVGAGKMGRSTLEDLRQRGALHVFLTNRTYSHAAELVAQVGGEAYPYEDLSSGIADADVVFLSTAASQPILHADLIAGVMAHRPLRPLLLVDLSVPRNVELKVRDIPNVRVYDMDDIQSFARSAYTSIRQDINRAEAIVAEETGAYEKLLRVIPFIGELHKKVEDIRQREVEKTLRHLRDLDLDPEVAAQIELLSRSLVRKILHEPTMHLRTAADEETLNDYVDALARLFDLSESRPVFSLDGES